MTTTMNKIWIATGAFALATSAVLVPLAAQAAPAGGSDSSAVGDSAGAPAPKRAARSASRAQVAAPAGAPRASVGGAPAAGATGPNPLFQNKLIWLGLPNPTPPPASYTRTFNPLASLPGWTTPYNGWYSNMNFEACVLGLSSTTVQSAGPYGTATSSAGLGGCA